MTQAFLETSGLSLGVSGAGAVLLRFFSLERNIFRCFFFSFLTCCEIIGKVVIHTKLQSEASACPLAPWQYSRLRMVTLQTPRVSFVSISIVVT